MSRTNIWRSITVVLNSISSKIRSSEQAGNDDFDDTFHNIAGESFFWRLWRAYQAWWPPWCVTWSLFAECKGIMVGYILYWVINNVLHIEICCCCAGVLFTTKSCDLHLNGMIIWLVRTLRCLMCSLKLKKLLFDSHGTTLIKLII